MYLEAVVFGGLAECERCVDSRMSGRRMVSGLGSEIGSRGRGLFFSSSIDIFETTESYIEGRTSFVCPSGCRNTTDGALDGQTDAASSKTPAETGLRMEYASADLYGLLSPAHSVPILVTELRRL